MVLDADSTSQSIYLVVLDSSSTTGGRKTGLAYNTASLTAYYTRAGGSATAITLATLAAANSAYSSGGFKEVDATNAPGLYRLDIPDAALVNGVNSVNVVLRGASGMVQVEKEISLRPLVPSVNVSKWLGTACATPTVAGVPEVDITHAGGTAITVAAGIPEVKVNNIAANAITATSINADAITAAKVADGTIDAATFAAGAITAAAIATDAIDADALATDAVTEIKNGVWGTTGLSALSRTTAGGILYSAGALSSTNSTVNDAGASTTVFVTALTSAVDDFYNDQTILFTDGALAGQSRIISNYDGTTKAITVDEALTSAPANGVAFTIYASHTHTTTSVGTAVWAAADRQLTAFDEDVTTIDINGTTIGTVTNLTNKGDGSGFTAIPWNAAWDAEVQSEAADALIAFFGANWAAAIATLMGTTIDGVTLTEWFLRVDAGTAGKRVISGTDPYTIECYDMSNTLQFTITATGGGGTVVYA